MAATGLDVGLRKDMQVCQDPMSFTPSVMIPLAGWQNGEPGNTVHLPTGVNAPGVRGLDYVMTMTGKADHIQLTATVDPCLLGACTPLLTLVQIEDQSPRTCASAVLSVLVWSAQHSADAYSVSRNVCASVGRTAHRHREWPCRLPLERRSSLLLPPQKDSKTVRSAWDPVAGSGFCGTLHTRLNEAFLSATRPSSQVPIAPLAAINTQSPRRQSHASLGVVYEGLVGMGDGERLAGHWLGAGGEAHAERARARGLGAQGERSAVGDAGRAGERRPLPSCPAHESITT